MQSNLEFLAGLLDADHPCVAQDDLEGEHASAVRVFQQMGFLAPEPGRNTGAGCPYCDEGVPYRLGDRYLCNRCRSTVDSRQLLLWPVRLESFLRWLATQLGLRGGVRPVEERLWQLGTADAGGTPCECFYRRPGALSDAGRERLALYRNAILVCGRSRPPEAGSVPFVSLLELLRLEDRLTLSSRAPPWAQRANVRFDQQSGALWAGDVLLGETPLGSREYYFLDCLARDFDQFVPYRDIKRYVLRHAGSRDTTEEATFCQGLKSRIKKKYAARIDLLVATSNKADGYRLRGYTEL